MRAIRSARFVLWLGCVLAYFAATYAADRSPANMANAANKFLSSLTPEQKQVAAFAFDNVAERERFGFVPTEMHPRVGLTIEKMTAPQREAAHNLLKSGLSQKGYMTTTAIMELETHPERDRESPGSNPPKLERNPLKYFVWVFGTPSAKGTWGWKVEGHHVSLNFTVVNGSMVSTAPHFFGSNPAEVMDGPKKGLRVLGYEEDPGRELVMSLERGTARQGGLQHHRTQRHRHAQRIDGEAALARRHRGQRAAAETARDADAHRRCVHRR